MSTRLITYSINQSTSVCFSDLRGCLSSGFDYSQRRFISKNYFSCISTFRFDERYEQFKIGLNDRFFITKNGISSSSKMENPAFSIGCLNTQDSALKSFFMPKSVCVIGATDRPNSVGRTICVNLLSGSNLNSSSTNPSQYQFDLCGVNPNKKEVLGRIKCYPSVKDLDRPVDLAIIVTPAHTVASVVREASEKGISSIVTISAGFREVGPEGEKMEKEILDIMANAKHSMRMIGPNCLGVMSPLVGLNATFASTGARMGNLAFISQSGAMCTSVLDWALKKNIGFSAFASVGSMADVGWGDLIEYLGRDERTHAILIYMETAGDARKLLSAAKQVTLSKPIICIKAGKSPEAAKAASSHTGSLAGSYDVFEAAMKRVGILTVDTIAELFDCAMFLAKQPRPQGNRLLIVTNAGGPGVLATDACVNDGACMSKLHDSTLEKLNEFLPSAWSHSNPVDVLGDAKPETYVKALSTCLDDPASDGVLVILSPQDVSDPTGTAKLLVPHVESAMKTITKPVFASWMGGISVAEGFHILEQAGIPVFEYPDEAARIFAKIWKQTKDLENMYETPQERIELQQQKFKQEQVDAIIGEALAMNASFLTEAQSKKILEIYDIPVVPAVACATSEEAVQVAEQIGFPVAVKLNSSTITHKSDVGGVCLNLKTTIDVSKAFEFIRSSVASKYSVEDFHGVTVQKMLNMEKGVELLVGSKTDEHFGPVIVFGAGGTMVEIFKDRALGIPPLNQIHARNLMKETKIYKALVGDGTLRFPGVCLSTLGTILVKFAQMVVTLRQVTECEINPLMASGKTIIGLDARFLIKKNATAQLAIRPYPSEYIFSEVKLRSGEVLQIRPLHAADEPKLRNFHDALSAETVRQRYLKNIGLQERAHRQALLWVCAAAYDRLIALGAIFKDADGTESMAGMCRIQYLPNNRRNAEFTIAVRDDWQKKGLGTELLKCAVHVQEQEKIETLHATFLKDNPIIQKLFKNFNFDIRVNCDNANLMNGLRELELNKNH